MAIKTRNVIGVIDCAIGAGLLIMVAFLAGCGGEPATEKRRLPQKNQRLSHQKKCVIH